eukprot:CAMPEP_0178998188 /NCGR_PEP_ID=MMETSP0795-20121207/9385_1 /TAXON_ID=88552 /ORGANISM="Amoebophrya sp., Strain Ameob2" /LENGTH=909 /DNA_ID=CAMNT_0020690861 /DNA_START=151 /DNA_END=2880 /DNA_ORIENTATION=+
MFLLAWLQIFLLSALARQEQPPSLVVPLRRVLVPPLEQPAPPLPGGNYEGETAPSRFASSSSEGGRGADPYPYSGPTRKRVILSRPELEALRSYNQLSASSGTKRKRKHSRAKYLTEKGTNAVTQLTNLYNSQYVGPIGVGSISVPGGCVKGINIKSSDQNGEDHNDGSSASSSTSASSSSSSSFSELSSSSAREAVVRPERTSEVEVEKNKAAGDEGSLASEDSSEENVRFILSPFVTSQQRNDCHYEEQSLINVVFDTGSTNLWIASDLCKEEPCTASDRHRYNHEISESFTENAVDRELDIEFGTGELKGLQGIDDFHVGPFTVRQQSFGLISEEIGDAFKSIPFEGILGLAFPSMSANGVTPFFDSVMQQGVLEKNEFAFYFNMEEAATAVSTLEATTSGASAMKGLDHMATTKSRNTSPPPMNALFWGGVDEHFYEAPIRRYNVTQEHYWSLDLLQFRVGNEVYDVETGKHLKNAHRLEGGDTSSGLLAAGMNSEGEMAEGIDAEGGINDEQEDGFGASIIDSVFPSMEDIFGSSPFGSTASSSSVLDHGRGSGTSVPRGPTERESESKPQDDQEAHSEVSGLPLAAGVHPPATTPASASSASSSLMSMFSSAAARPLSSLGLRTTGFFADDEKHVSSELGRGSETTQKVLLRKGREDSPDARTRRDPTSFVQRSTVSERRRRKAVASARASSTSPRRRNGNKSSKSSIVDGDVHEITIRPFTLDGELAREQEELKNAASTSFFETTETSARLHHAKLVVDTGTTYFTAGKHLYATLRDRLPPVPCSEISSTKYPPLVYVLENSETGQYEELLIPQEIYMVTDESDNCDLAFMEIDLPEGYGPGMLLGEVFMRHYFTVFTREDGAKKPTVGFAHAKVGNGPLERLRQLTADSKPSFSSASPGGG